MSTQERLLNKETGETRKVKIFLEDKVWNVLLFSPVKSYLYQVTHSQYTSDQHYIMILPLIM